MNHYVKDQFFKGNLTADPEQYSLSDGNTLTKFTLANTPRFKNSTTGAWDSGETKYQDVTTTNKALGQHIQDTLKKGDAAIAHGDLEIKPYLNQKTGEAGLNKTLKANTVAADLKFNSATINRTEKHAQTSNETQVSQEFSQASNTASTGQPAAKWDNSLMPEHLQQAAPPDNQYQAPGAHNAAPGQAMGR